MIPRWLRAVLVIACAAALLWGVRAWESHIYQRGYDAAAAEAREREERVSKEAALKHAADLEEAAARGQLYLRWYDELLRQRHQENQEYERKIDHWRAAARAGAVRLSVPVDAGTLPRCTAAADPAAAAGSGGETRADVVPEIAEEVLRAAADLARGVRDRNVYIDLYNEARTRCTGGE